MDEEEAAELGPILRKVTRALREVTGCSKTYVALFAEAEGYTHVHFHVVPRMEEFTEEQRGPKSLHAFLGAGDRSVPDAEMDGLALALQRELD